MGGQLCDKKLIGDRALDGCFEGDAMVFVQPAGPKMVQVSHLQFTIPSY